MIPRAIKFMRASFGSFASTMIKRLMISVANEVPSYISMISNAVEFVLSPFTLTKLALWFSW
jgi:hypothetical protein